MNSYIEGQLKISISELIIKSADHLDMDPLVLLHMAASQPARGELILPGFSDAEKITIELIWVMIKPLDTMLLDCLFEQVRSQA